MERIKQARQEVDGSYVLSVRSPIPSKKNKLRPRSFGRGAKRGVGLMYDEQTKAEIVSIATQLRILWGGRPPLTHPRVTVFLHVFNEAKDRDGMWTAVLDAMKTAGIIPDDAWRVFNGEVIIAPARKVRTESLERVDLVIFPDTAYERSKRL